MKNIVILFCFFMATSCASIKSFRNDAYSDLKVISTSSFNLTQLTKDKLELMVLDRSIYFRSFYIDLDTVTQFDLKTEFIFGKKPTLPAELSFKIPAQLSLIFVGKEFWNYKWGYVYRSLSGHKFFFSETYGRDDKSISIQKIKYKKTIYLFPMSSPLFLLSFMDEKYYVSEVF